MCYGLIEYEFYLPANMTQGEWTVEILLPTNATSHLFFFLFFSSSCFAETWNYYARTFGYGYDGALSTECREAVKRNICQKLYMRCPENVDLDVNSYDFF